MAEGEVGISVGVEVGASVGEAEGAAVGEAVTQFPTGEWKKKSQVELPNLESIVYTPSRRNSEGERKKVFEPATTFPPSTSGNK
jgi:hypothetical protein